MIKINLNYANIVKINCICTEEQGETLKNYFYGQVFEGFDEHADYFVNYKGNIKNRKIKNLELLQKYDSFRNPSYVCLDTKNNVRIAFATDQGFNSKHIVVSKNNEFAFFDEERSGDTLIVAICREIVIRKLLHMKFFPMHSASFSNGKNAVVIFGQRKSGKSSTMIFETFIKKYNMVANDIQFVGKINGQWVCASIPYDITVGGDLLNAIGVNVEYGNEKLRYTPKQFCEIYGVKQDWVVPIKLMINTRLNLESQEVRVSQIPFSERPELYVQQSRENWTFDDAYKIKGQFEFDYEGLSRDIPLLLVEGKLLDFFNSFNIETFNCENIPYINISDKTDHTK